MMTARARPLHKINRSQQPLIYKGRARPSSTAPHRVSYRITGSTQTDHKHAGALPDDGWGPLQWFHNPNNKHTVQMIKYQVLRPLASWLCPGAPERNIGLPTVGRLAKALDRVLVEGLPVVAETAGDELYAFLPLIPQAETDEERLARLNSFLDRHLADLDADGLKDYAWVLFAYRSFKSTKLNVRGQKVADMINSARPPSDAPITFRSIIQTRSQTNQRGAQTSVLRRWRCRSTSNTPPRTEHNLDLKVSLCH